jgi:hypothetical protein
MAVKRSSDRRVRDRRGARERNTFLSPPAGFMPAVENVRDLQIGPGEPPQIRRFLQDRSGITCSPRCTCYMV